MASSHDLCPYEDRRTPRMLYVKLFVTLFTVLGSLSHLLHVRRDYRLATGLVIMLFVSPITTAAYLLLPIIALPLLLVIARGDLSVLKQELRLLVGQKRKDDTEDDHHRLSWITLLRSVLLLGVATQCITSIYYFSIRFRSGSAALYDHYILQLACVGALSSCFSLVRLILGPFSIPQSIEIAPNLRWLLHYRFDRYRTDPEDSLLVRYMRQSLSYYWYFLFLSLIGMVATLLSQIWGLDSATGMTMMTMIAILAVPVNSAVRTFMLIFGSIVAIYGGCIIAYFRPQWRRPLRFVALLIFMAIFQSVFYPTGWLCLDILKFSVCSGGYNVQLVLPALEYPVMSNGISVADGCQPTPASFPWRNESEWNRIATFGAVPVACPCPKAQTNDAIDWLWMLA